MVASIALILGVDRFMSEARALTNLIGNGLATVVVAKWEGALDEVRMHAHLDRETSEEADAPEKALPAPEPQDLVQSVHREGSLRNSSECLL